MECAELAVVLERGEAEPVVFYKYMLVCGLTGKGMGGVTGDGRLRAGDWLGRCGGDCCGCPEVEEQVEPGDGTEVCCCCWLGGVM